jgi:hypothetical protein
VVPDQNIGFRILGCVQVPVFIVHQDKLMNIPIIIVINHIIRTVLPEFPWVEVGSYKCGIEET